MNLPSVCFMLFCYMNCWWFMAINPKMRMVNSGVFMGGFLVSIVFLTLLERNLLGLSQNRQSPSKTNMKGILQPILDGLKLLMSETPNLSHNHEKILTFLTLLGFFCLSLNFQTTPSKPNPMSWPMSFVIFLTLITLSVFMLMGLAFFSSSKYTTLGALRAASQAVSFDLSILLVLVLSMKTKVSLEVPSYWAISMNLIWLNLLMILSLMEMGRTPFDLPEGESELVSGFNTELSSTFFVLVFLTEYGSLLLLSCLCSCLLVNFKLSGVIFFSVMFLASRAVLPRLRVDKVLGLSFKSLTAFLNLFLLGSWGVFF